MTLTESNCIKVRSSVREDGTRWIPDDALKFSVFVVKYGTSNTWAGLGLELRQRPEEPFYGRSEPTLNVCSE